jgi:hypothetical protein
MYLLEPVKAGGPETLIVPKPKGCGHFVYIHKRYFKNPKANDDPGPVHHYFMTPVQSSWPRVVRDIGTELLDVLLDKAGPNASGSNPPSIISLC